MTEATGVQAGPQWAPAGREELLAEARFHRLRQNWKEAARIYGELAWNYPEEAYFLEQAALCCQHLGRGEESERLLARAARLYARKGRLFAAPVWKPAGFPAARDTTRQEEKP